MQWRGCWGGSHRSGAACTQSLGAGSFQVLLGLYAGRCSCSARSAWLRSSGTDKWDLDGFTPLFSQALLPPCSLEAAPDPVLEHLLSQGTSGEAVPHAWPFSPF